MTQRVITFIDGFNLYHALAEKPDTKRYRWLDLWTLSQRYVTSRQTLKSVYYFTALAKWDSGKVQRHNLYISALKHRGVKVVLGKFKRVTRKCRECHDRYQTYEEKETDVNIALEVYRQGVRDKFDTAHIISGDSDLIPSIRMIREDFPDKKITTIVPVGHMGMAMKNEGDRHFRMKAKHLAESQLEKQIKLKNGVVLAQPDSWK